MLLFYQVVAAVCAPVAWYVARTKFLDDGIYDHKTKLNAQAASQIQQLDLQNAGLTVNNDKSDWVPRQVGEWLVQYLCVFMYPHLKSTMYNCSLGA